MTELQETDTVTDLPTESRSRASSSRASSSGALNSPNTPDSPAEIESRKLSISKVSISPKLNGYEKIKREKAKPSFNYELDLFQLCQRFLEEKNHHGLALIARQKGLPPFLRFKIWPILLKYHPYVVKPSIQPDNIEKNSLNEEKVLKNIKKDLNKYLTRLKYGENNNEIIDDEENLIEKQVFEILESSILKFILKWGKIIKYDSALTWMALGLAEWFPPIPNSSYVLVGRDLSDNKNAVKNLFIDYSNYIDNVPQLNERLDALLDDEVISNMSFHDVYERLVLVLLHCPSNKLKSSHDGSKTVLNNERLLNLPSNGGTIEERVTFFIYVFRKLLPELSNYFNEEQILNKFGSNDDEWLIWWLKYCGSKVWSRLDRGKIWDILLGFKFKTPGKDYNDQLHLDNHILLKLGNTDNFWSLNFDPASSVDLCQLNLNSIDVPFPQMNPHIELIFITVALLKSKENTLIDLDQHEIRQYLLRLPTNSYNLTNKYQIFKQKIDKKREEENSKPGSRASRSSRSSRSSTMDIIPPSISPENNNIITNDSLDNHSIDFMDNILNEAGELWRKWLWLENEAIQ